MTEQIDFAKNDGLVPAILQDVRTGQVLMLGYMNEEAYQRTREEKVAWFYSRSKGRLWMKGEESGNIQRVKEIRLDCDQDTLLVLVDPAGPTCHLGTQSCFGDRTFNLEMLEQTVAKKVRNPQPGSYTNYLVSEGLDKILKKVGEEAAEVIIAAKNQDREELIAETSDFLYHLLVLLNQQDVSLADVKAQLAERHGEKQVYSVRSEIEEW
ncbi:bifunctional phosphoribosyl-AMP cyclohydrolase/phosphoribosyl-ATP diphosphatase [Suicoccus acidiformans]|uniref:Histidine biosynthesis bifunctional protein HisIE n=1 Tax=Suicoccus acidiformans TaxID=2036206 RepID=A0A347WL28_9LACT|nr:bifunctional phosphoribosyl-AMP cyclohydrolase/phosphoribosyl-ATP diphosphatase HisIE [Suicoccus acidiformans]AXY25785.1 bifunctional phosphoribosyl-AMP cyclohydrolase/phosphoribosyl-ATP diphosphatase [Suicoccus acidiformans]